MKRYLFLLLLSVWGWCPVTALALTPLTDTELSAITGTGAVDFSVNGGVMRIFIDTQLAIHAEIDSLKLGYYKRTNLRTRKFLDPTDKKIAQGKYTGFVPLSELPVDAFAMKEIERQCEGQATPEGVGLYYVDSDEVMFKHKEVARILGRPITGYLQGPAGIRPENIRKIAGLASLEKLGIVKTPERNRAKMDWDINWENVRLGKSREEPLRLNGLIIRVHMDESRKRVTDLIIGSNDVKGEFYADMLRTTGYLNGKLAAHARMQGHQAKGMAPEFQETPIPVIMKRDSFLYWVDHYKFVDAKKQVYLMSVPKQKLIIERLVRVFNEKAGGDAEKQKINDLVRSRMKREFFIDKNGDTLKPGTARIDIKNVKGVQFVSKDPANATDRSAFFLRFGFDPNSPTFGVNLIAGYGESVAATMDYSGKNITESLKEDWWTRPEVDKT